MENVRMERDVRDYDVSSITDKADPHLEVRVLVRVT